MRRFSKFGVHYCSQSHVWHHYRTILHQVLPPPACHSRWKYGSSSGGRGSQYVSSFRIYHLLNYHIRSHVSGSREIRWHNRSKRHSLHRRCHLHYRRRYSNLLKRILLHDNRTDSQWFRSWTIIVSLATLSQITVLKICRTIVPIYQSEISPPSHVRINRSLHSYPLTMHCCACRLSERRTRVCRIHGEYCWICIFSCMMRICSPVSQ